MMLMSTIMCVNFYLEFCDLWRLSLTLAGVSLAVSESDQRCLSWEELGTHSQNVCVRQIDRATSVGVCSSYMCIQPCKHMHTNTQVCTCIKRDICMPVQISKLGHQFWISTEMAEKMKVLHAFREPSNHI